MPDERTPTGPSVEERTARVEALKEDKRQMKDTLIYLDTASKEIKADLMKVEDLLNSVDTRLTVFEYLYPDDEDLALIRRMYNDLYGDFERIRAGMVPEKMRLDESYRSIVTDIGEMIDSAGVVKESPEDTVLRDQVDQLAELGIDSEYVLTRGDSSAPTVVLFMHIHDNPGFTDEMRDEIGITASEDQINTSIDAAVDAGMIGEVYVEGLVHGARWTKTIADNSIAAGHRALENDIASKHGDSIDVIGYEEHTIAITALQHDELIPYRVTSQNVLIASNVAESVYTSRSPMSFMVIGAGHEEQKIPGAPKHQLPISKTLAYYGVNVIVVDASSALNMDAVKKYQKELEEAYKALSQSES